MGLGGNTYIDRYNQSIGKIGTNLGMAPQSDMGSANTATNYSANNDYAVGSRTYNGSSNSPHAGSGGIDTAGYATRDNQAQTQRRQMLLQMLNKSNGTQ